MTGVITSLPPVIQQPPGNASANPAGLPGVTYSAAIPTLAQTWTGLQTYAPNSIEFAGSTSGNTFLNASAIASGTVVLPAIVGTDTLLTNNNVATVTNKSIDGTTNTLTNIPVSSFSHTGTGAVVLTNSPVITTPTGIVKADVGLGNVANVDTTNAANISSGTLPSGRLPNPSAATLGGIQSAAVVSHQWINSISTSGVPALSQPAFADISGSIAATQLPNPSATTLGGIESLAAVGSKWINTISTSGVPSATQPTFTDISGSIAAGQIPANVVTNAMAAQMAAATLKGNVTGSTANASDFTIQGLVNLASPSPTLDFIPIYDHVSGTIKSATPSSVGAAGAVSSIGAQVGALTIAGGNLSSTVIPVARYDAAQTLTTTQQDQLRSNTAIQTGGGYSNIVSLTTGANTMTITADAVALFNSSGNMFGAASVSLTLTVSGSGANGLDTGSLATTQYYYFIIYNPTTGTVACLASLSATAPTMPSGYTYKRRIGWFNYSSGITSFVQRNNQFTWTSPRSVASGTQVASANFTLATLCSPVASRVFGYFVMNNNSVLIGDNTGTTIAQSSGIAAQNIFQWSFTPGNTTYQMAYQSSSAGGQLSVTGWEDNI